MDKKTSKKGPDNLNFDKTKPRTFIASPFAMGYNLWERNQSNLILKR